MSLRENDLQDTILEKISFDEFLPKTGEETEVAVIGFYLTGEEPGKDLYVFLNTSVVDNRDVELSPNPDEDGYFMVFVELDRDSNLLKNVRAIVDEINRVSGKLSWVVKTPYTADLIPLEDADGKVQEDQTTYLPAEEFRDKMEAESASLEDAIDTTDEDGIMEFFKDSNLLDLTIEESILNIKDARNKAKLEIVSFGFGPDVLRELGINESAIGSDFDKNAFIKLKGMLGEMHAIPIDKYVVIYNTNSTNVLVAKAF
jgi:hypothetical protein